MSQPYQNQPASGYGGAYGSAYYSPQSPYAARPPFSPSPFPQHGAHPPAPFQPAPADGYNVARFDANSQAHLPVQPLPFAPSSFPPEMLKQIANSSIPPPPPPGFPPFSFPNLNFPPFPPVPSVQNQTYSPPQQEESDEGSDAYDPRFPQNLPQSSSRPVTGSGSLRKSGQQQMAVAAVPQTLPQFHTQSAQSYQQPGADAGFPPNMDGASLSTQNQSPFPPPLPINTAQTPVTAIPDLAAILATSPPGPKTSQPRSPPSNETVPTHEPRTTVQMDRPEEGNLGSRQDYTKMGTEELRNLAKGAIASLAPRNIVLDDMIKEGIEPTLLHTLYSELGLPTNRKSGSQEAVQPVTSSEPPVVEEATGDKNLQPPIGVSPSMERKDRIAQLLAAKAAKPGTARVVSDSGTSSEVQEATAASIDKPAHMKPVSSDAVSKAHGVAQAEVVRQRMQLMRKESLEMQSRQEAGAGGLSTMNGAPPREPAKQATAFQSSLPGLGMMAVESEPTTSVVPAKRALDLDNASSDSAVKRRNTGSFQQDKDVEMDVDQPSSGEASEGEVTDSAGDQPTSKQTEIHAAKTVAKPTITPTSKPVAPVAGGKLTQEQLAEKARELKARFLQQRARKQALQEGIPNIAAEVAKAEDVLSMQRSQLEETRRRIKTLESELITARLQENAQLAQVQRSEEQVRQGMSGQKKFTEELQTLSQQQNSVDRSLAETQQAVASPAVETPRPLEPISDAIVDSTQQTSASQSDVSSGAEQEVLADNQKEGGLEEATGSNHVSPPDEAAHDDDLSDDHSASMGESTQSEEAQAEEGVEDDLPVLTHENAQNNESAVVTPYEDHTMDDTESDGSASMVDSASDASQDEGEYSPPEDDPTQPMEIDDGSSDDYDPTQAPVEFVHEVSETEHAANLTNALQEPEAEQIQSSMDEGEVEDGAEENAVEKGLNRIEQQDINIAPEAPRLNGSESDYPTSRYSAPATPHGWWDRGRKRNVPQPLSNSGINRSTSFSAYESPLSAYPSYRYNEHFSEAAKDGYRSLTYSNSIDPRTPLCPTELSGETCQDPTCEEQHFRHLGLTDDKILVQMSSAHEFTDKEVRDRYLLGLKGVIADLRTQNVRDFEDVAKALSEYRRKFVAEL